MKFNIYFFNCNNYFNRKFLLKDTIAEYIALDSSYYKISNVFNFDYGDGIDTKQIINTNKTADYCVVTNAESNDAILSRWFVMDTQHKRDGQWQASLFRDVKADSYSIWVNAPSFIEKGTIKSLTDPAIFNKEQMTVNQIKKKEYYVADRTKCPWIVGYIKKGETGSGSFTPDDIVDINQAGVTLSAYLTSIGIDTTNEYIRETGSSLDVNFLIDGTSLGEAKVFSSLNGNDFRISGSKNADNTVKFRNLSNDYILAALNGAKEDYSAIYDNMISGTKSELNVSNSKYNTIISLNGKKIHTSDGYYEFSFEYGYKSSTSNLWDYSEIESTSSLTYKANAFLAASYNDIAYPSTPRTDTFTASYSGQTAKLIATDISASHTYQWTIDTGRVKTEDQVYDCFAIPYGDIFLINHSGTTVTDSTSKKLAMELAYDISKTLTSDKLIDMQIIPFCPLPNLISTTDDKGGIQYLGSGASSSNVMYTLVSNTDDNDKTVIFYINSSKFTGDADYIYRNIDTSGNISNEIAISSTDIFDTSDIEEMKKATQCDLWRLCSPNFNGQYEFNPKACGPCSYFNYDVSLIPYNPYIHVNPAYNSGILYQQDFNDPTGLICSGDFSLSQTSDAWQKYQIENKTYQDQFDRKIQNMEYNNKWALANSIVGAASGVVTGTTRGAIAGGVGGAIGGGVASAIGGIADVAQTYGTQKEALDYSQDLFNMSLENIKALPDSITKVSTINNNNKGFVVLEYYSCTDEEKEAYDNKITYNGMTINRIGKFIDFIDTSIVQYVKGQPIRLDDLTEDTHYARVLSDELNKGVYI